MIVYFFLKHTKITLIKNKVLLEKPLYSNCICKKSFPFDIKHKAQYLLNRKSKYNFKKVSLKGI